MKKELADYRTLAGLDTSHVSLQTEATTDPADLAASLVDKGMDNPILKRVKAAYDDLVQEIKDAQKMQAAARKHGYGETESEAIAKRVVSALEDLAETATTGLSTIRKMLP